MGDLAEATAISPTEIMVDGKAPGETSLIIWDIHGGRQFFNVTVRPLAALSGDNLDAIRRELRTELPGRIDQGDLQQQHHFPARDGEGPDQRAARGADRIDGGKSGEPD